MTVSEALVSLSQWQLALTAMVFIVCLGAEQLWPQGGRRQNRLRRWGLNLCLFASGFVILLAVGPWIQRLAGAADRLIPFPPLVGMGLPTWLLVLVSFLLIDLIGYLMHASFHVVPPLWRLHRTHHSDRQVDASTGVRHHPLEALAIGVIQFVLLAILGVPLLVVIAYSLIALVWQFVTHLDVALPEPVDRVVRLVLVTPGMHRVHHSVRMDEGNSNFGMVLSIWDRLFGSYRRRPAPERPHMALGIEGDVGQASLVGVLADPLRP